MVSVSDFLCVIFVLLKASAAPPIFFDADLASERFRTDVATAYGISQDHIEIVPALPGIPGNGFFELATDNLYAFQARFVINGEQASVNGFSSIGGVETVLVKSPAGLGPLLSEARVLMPYVTMPLDQLVARLAFVLHGFGKPAEHPGAPWTLERTGSSVVITYLTLSHGQTGVMIVRQVRIEALPGEKPVVSAMPFDAGPMIPVLATINPQPWYPPFGTPEQ